MVSLKEGTTHFLAIVIILPYVYLLVRSAFDPNIEIPQILSTTALLVLGYYFGTFNKKNS